MIKIHDVLGIGFGPSNVGLAIALQENERPLSTVFLEKSMHFSWHQGMLLPDATMQVSFLKDLVNLRNPQSPHTFVNYLHEKGRLADFINLKTFYPSRREFHDYLSWCAAKFDHQVQYAHEVVAIELDHFSFDDPLYKVTAQTPAGQKKYFARSIVHSCGLEPTMPKGLRESERVFHNQALLDRLGCNPVLKGSHYVVVGAGQSAAEVVEYLLARDPACQVTAIVSRYGYMPSDDSPFVNQVFDPEFVDGFFEASEEERRRILNIHSSTNYSVVDIDVIERLYWGWYQDKVHGRARLKLKRLSYLLGVTVRNDALVVSVKDFGIGETEAFAADCLICATGFRPRNPIGMMSNELTRMILLDNKGFPAVSRDYRVQFEDQATPPCFIVGTSELSHGLTSTLISNIAVRSGELTSALIKALDTRLNRTNESIGYVTG